MNNQKTGGHAFPSTTERMNPFCHTGSTITTETPGMTLRDYFAAHAPISLADAMKAVSGAEGRACSMDEAIEKLSELCSKYADAMVARRLVDLRGMAE